MGEFEALRRVGGRGGAAGREERKGGEEGGNPKAEGRRHDTKHPISNIQHPTANCSQPGKHRMPDVWGEMAGVSWIHWNRSFSAGVGTAANRGEIRSPKGRSPKEDRRAEIRRGR